MLVSPVSVRRLAAMSLACLALAAGWAWSPAAWAQEDAAAETEADAGADAEVDPEALAAEALATPEDEAAEDEAAAADTGGTAPPEEKSLNLLDLLWDGGALMIPILLMSVVVVTFGVERAVALRRNKVCPEEFVEALGSISERKGRFDPREAYKICQQYPSSAANVIRRALLKVGRPLSEIEHAVKEVSEREATRLYSNVRPIGLAMAISPLLGLLGTVWGMIQAFFVTASLPATANKAEFLAEGIYVALVTTFAGLAVAIPAAILAHYFEGRIANLFHDIDDLVQSLMPQLERYEGKMRRGESRSSTEGNAARGDAEMAARNGDKPVPEVSPVAK